jgi:hypothetical protein
MTADEERELAGRIRARRWGWQKAFAAWHLVHGDTPMITLQADGTRDLTWEPPQFLKTHLGNLPRLGLGDVVQEDGTLQLDTAGKHRYRPLGQVESGFTAYERIRE